MLENRNSFLMALSDFKVYLDRLLSWRTFTMSSSLQAGVGLLRRLRPLSRMLAFSHPFRAKRCESSPIPNEDVLATRSRLLYAGRL